MTVRVRLVALWCVASACLGSVSQLPQTDAGAEAEAEADSGVDAGSTSDAGVDAGVELDSFYFGWNVHLASYDKRGVLMPVFAKLQEIGANSLRGGLEWTWMQYQNTTSFSSSPELQAETNIVNANTLSANPMSMLDVVGFANELFWHQATQDITVNPTTPGSVFDTYAKGYVKYVQHEMELRPRQTFYEIHNEWNYGFHIDSATPNYDLVRLGDTYARLFVSVAPAIRTKNASAKILTAGVADCKGPNMPWGACYPWVIDQLEYIAALHGSLDLVDGVAVHTYADTNTLAMPERLYSGLLSGRDWLMQQSPAFAANPKDFYLTEAGFPQITAGNGTLTEQEQSNNLQRLFFLYRTLPYVKGIWVYDFIDDSLAGREGSFGVLKNDQGEKVAYGQLKALSPLIKRGTSWVLLHGDVSATPWAKRLTDQWISRFPKQFFAVQALYANQRVTMVWSPTAQPLNVQVTSADAMTMTTDFAVPPVALETNAVLTATSRPLFIFQAPSASLTLK